MLSRKSPIDLQVAVAYIAFLENFFRQGDALPTEGPTFTGKQFKIYEALNRIPFTAPWAAPTPVHGVMQMILLKKKETSENVVILNLILDNSRRSSTVFFVRSA